MFSRSHVEKLLTSFRSSLVPVLLRSVQVVVVFVVVECPAGPSDTRIVCAGTAVGVRGFVTLRIVAGTIR